MDALDSELRPDVRLRNECDLVQEYFFDMGNSTIGPIGFCARVWAETAEEAAEKVRDSLPEWLEMAVDDKSISYINVYFNPDALTASDAKDSAEW